MPRFARSRTRVVSRKKQTKWCARATDLAVPDPGNLVVGDAIPLCQPTAGVVDEADIVMGWCRGQISISRVDASNTTPAVAWAIVRMRTNPGGTLPVQIFNPFDVLDLERQDILGMGHIRVPPIVLIPSTDLPTIDRSSSVVDINIKTSRKVARNSNNLFLWIVALSVVDNGILAKSSVRTLMKFG